MDPFYADDWLQIFEGDCRKVLASLPDESVHLCVTSPPYYSLRAYGTEPQIWGEHIGLDHFQHEWADDGSCSGCEAWKGELGQEPTPDLFVDHLVEVFRGVRRVLRSDGLLFLNMGDSYAANWNSGRAEGGAGFKDNERWRKKYPPPGMKSKDLMGIPWMLAFALRRDGWYLRNDIVWAVPNPMPESVTDRFTSSHEHVFMFAKGSWKSRVIKVSDSSSEPVHLVENVGPQNANVWASRLSIGLASSIANGSQFQEQQGLGTFDAQVRQQESGGARGDAVSGLPVVHRSALHLARNLLQSNMSAKEFLGEIYRLGVRLTDSHDLEVGGIATYTLSPSVHANGKTSIAVHDSGEIGEFRLDHGDIIVSRPDRCTYFFDQDAVREPHLPITLNRIKYGLNQNHPGDIGIAIPPVHTTHVAMDEKDGLGGTMTKGVMGERFANPLGRNRRDVWSIPTVPYKGAHYAVFPPKLVEPMILAGTSAKGVCVECGAPWRRITERTRKPRGDAFGTKSVGEYDHGQAGSPYMETVSVETIGWEPTCEHDLAREYRECPECGAAYKELEIVDQDPWLDIIDPSRPQAVRAVEIARLKGLTIKHIEALRAAGITDAGKSQTTQTGWGNNTAEVQRLAAEAKEALGGYTREFTFIPPRTKGWTPTCEHEARDVVPATVLDIFGGSGTVAMVAQQHSRRAVLIDLNPEYLKQQLLRNAQTPLGLMEPV